MGFVKNGDTMSKMMHSLEESWIKKIKSEAVFFGTPIPSNKGEGDRNICLRLKSHQSHFQVLRVLDDTLQFGKGLCIISSSTYNLVMRD